MVTIRRAPSTHVFSTSLVALLGLSALCDGAFAQASAQATIVSMYNHCPGTPDTTQPPVSTTSVTAIAAHAGPACAQHASAYSYLGVVGASALTQNLQGYLNGETGGVSFASGGWSEGLSVAWPERFQVEGIDRLRLHFNVGATGGVSASRQSHPNNAEAYIAVGNADIQYTFSFAGTVYTGRQHVDGGGALTQVGEWGTVSGVVDLDAVASGAGGYTFGSIGLSLSGQARAAVLASIGTASASADFGSTLQWQGVSAVSAFDENDHEIELPDGFQLALIGQLSGFDYWNEAIKTTDTDPRPQPVSAPAPVGLLLGGLALLAGRQRQRRRC